MSIIALLTMMVSLAAFGLGVFYAFRPAERTDVDAPHFVGSYFRRN